MDVDFCALALGVCEVVVLCAAALGVYVVVDVSQIPGPTLWFQSLRDRIIGGHWMEDTSSGKL